MSSPCRASIIVFSATALGLSACSREENHSGKPVAETIPAGQSPDTIWPGGTTPPALDARAKLYDNNAPAISQGQTLFAQMNCSGCHSHGGGGMGPALIDDEWRYGGRIDQIGASIAEGRPNGMPSWRAKLTEEQIWQLAAYVRSMSGQPSKDAISARTDEMSNTNPQTLTPREPAHTSDTAEQ